MLREREVEANASVSSRPIRRCSRISRCAIPTARRTSRAAPPAGCGAARPPRCSTAGSSSWGWGFLAAFPVESRWGYHVVTVDERRPDEALGFDAVRGQISDYLELQALRRALQCYLRGLQQRHGVHWLEEIEAQVA